jgi:hypothetical protein
VRYRVTRVDPFQVAKVMGVLYIVMGLVFAALFFMVSKLIPTEAENAVGFPFSSGLMLVLPIFYGVIGFIATLIGAALYNMVAGFVGGIDVELDGVGASVNAGAWDAGPGPA